MRTQPATLSACCWQVPLLLEMGETHVALGKAAASGDTDLLYLALLHGKVAVDAKQLDAADFFFRDRFQNGRDCFFPLDATKEA